MRVLQFNRRVMYKEIDIVAAQACLDNCLKILEITRILELKDIKEHIKQSISDLEKLKCQNDSPKESN